MTRRVSGKRAVAAGVAATALLVSGCSVSTTSATTVAPVEPISSESPAPELDLQLRPVLDVSAADPASCPIAASTPPPKAAASLCSTDRRARYSLGPAALTGPRVTSIEPLYSATGVVVAVKVDAMGKAALSNVTLESSFKAPPQSQLAIVSRGTVLVAPAVTEQVDGGVLLLTGFASMDAARSTVDFITR